MTRKSAVKSLCALPAGSLIFYVAFLLFASSQMITSYSAIDYCGYSGLETLCRGAKLVAMMLLALKLALFQRYASGRLFVVVALCLLGLLTYRATGSLAVLCICLFVAAGQHVRMRVIAVLSLVSSVFVISFCLVGCLAGLLPDLCFLRESTMEVRHSLGFSHPNSFGLMVTEATVCILVLRAEKVGLPEAMICLASILLIDAISDSRTGMAGIAIAYVLFFCRAHLRNGYSKHVFMVFVTTSVLLVTIMSFWLMINYDSSRSLDYFLNQLVSGRPSKAHWYFVNYSPGLFGQNTSLLPVFYTLGGLKSNTFWVDNSYANLFLHYGPVAFCVLVGLVVGFLVTSCRRGDMSLAFVGLAFAAIYGFAESYFIDLEFNYFLIGTSWLLYGFPNRATDETVQKQTELALYGRACRRVSGPIHTLSADAL